MAQKNAAQQSEKPKPRKTRLRITACWAAYHGTQANGHGYTIYNVEAEKLDGTPVAEELRSFEWLPEVEQDLNVVAFTTDNKVSYTLSQRGGSRERRISDLEARMAAIERVLGMEVQDAIDRRQLGTRQDSAHAA